MTTATLKSEWAFVGEDALVSNIAAALQDVHFDILLVNNYNVFWTPLSMKYKHALVQIASVAEAVLAHMVQMVEDDPGVRTVLGEKWNWLDFNAVPLAGRVDLPDAHRVISGIQQKVEAVLDRNTKMRVLIRGAAAVGILDAEMTEEIDKLRELRNRIHIKTLTEPEYDQYRPQQVNDALNLLERFRGVATAWTVSKRQESLAESLAGRVRAAPITQPSDSGIGTDDLVEHSALGQGVVTSIEAGGIAVVRFLGDGTERRLMLQYAGLRKVEFVPADDDIPF